MQAKSVIRIEKNVDRAASAVLAGACAYAAYMWLSAKVAQPFLVAETAAAAAFGYVVSMGMLSEVRRTSDKLPVPIFDVRDVEPIDAPEPTIVEPEQAVAPLAEEPLVLEDVLEVEPDSRVIRMFDRTAMPTPGQLNDRIERHLEGGAPPAPQDASQALHEALAELRRSLR